MSVSFTIAIAVLCLTLLANAGLFLGTQKNRGTTTVTDTFFRIHVVTLAGWGSNLLFLLLYGWMQSFPTFYPETVGYTLGKLVFLAASALFIANFWFVYVYRYGRVLAQWWLYVLVLLQFTAVALSVIDGTLFTSFQIVSGGYIIVEPGPYEGLYGLFLLVHMIAPVVLLYFTWRQAGGVGRVTARLLFIYYVLFLLVSMTFNWVLPIYFNFFYLNAYGPTTSLILLVGIAYLILRFSFLELRSIIQRGIIYTVVLVFVVLLYVSVMTLLHRSLGTTGEDFLATVGMLSVTLLALVTVPPLDAFLRRRTDKIFFKDRYDYRQTLYELSQIQKRNVTWSDITRKCAETLASHLRVERVDFLDECGCLSAEYTHDFLCAPIKFNGRCLASVHVHSKKSGEGFTADDFVLVTTFAEQAAVAFEKARLFSEVQEYSETLEQRVTDRTADIERLQKAQEDMLFEISHNMQTPLTILKNDVDRLKGEMTNKDSQRAVRSFERSVDDVSHFTKRLLQLGKYQVDEAITDTELFAVSEIMVDLCEYFGTVAEQQGVRFTCRLAPNVHIEANRKQFEEIMANLVSNAIKYRRKISDSTILCSLRVLHGKVEISVIDNGQGVSEDKLPHVFDRFYRAGDGRVSGSGLGLALTKAMVERNGGSIWLDSTLGVGTTVTVTFAALQTKRGVR